MIEIDFINEFQDCLQLTRAAQSVYTLLGLKGNLIVELDFVDKDGIQALNKEYRQKDSPTDVLSFPSINLKSNDYKVFDKNNYPLDIAFDDVIMLGSIIICPSVMQENAQEYNHSQTRELFYLFVHGLLHLLGFDHIKKSDKDIMRKMEESVLDDLGISRE